MSKLSRLSIVVISATTITCGLIYNAYKPNAYEVYVNGKSIAYVRDKEAVDLVKEDILSEATKRFGAIKANTVLSYESIIADSKAIINYDTLKTNLIKVMNLKVNAVEMKVDNKVLGIIANEREGEEIIKSISDYYLANIELEDKKFVRVKNNITYVNKEVLLSSVSEKENIVSNIIDLNNKSETPVLALEFSGKSLEKAQIKYNTNIILSEKLSPGENKIKTKGEVGEKEISKEIILVNEKVIQENKKDEKITKKPVDEVVLRGTYSNKTAIAMYTPSRGKISSSFGERWGKMHEGIDIAANQGDPIYAALDGKVSFSGWQNGYGYVIIITHKEGMETVYAHCSKLISKVGDVVKKGQLIGYVGSTGNSTGPHLHFEVRVNGKPQNPVPYVYN